MALIIGSKKYKLNFFAQQVSEKSRFIKKSKITMKWGWIVTDNKNHGICCSIKLYNSVLLAKEAFDAFKKAYVQVENPKSKK